VSIDRQKVIDAAQKFAAKGQFDKAVAEYQKLVKDDPNDVRILLKIGDLQVRRGAREDAIATYSRVARGYDEQGFALKAIAVYKQILSIDPNLTELYSKLASLYVKLGLLPDALSNLETLAARYARAGQDDKLVGVVREMVEIDPNNVATRIKLAELLSRMGKNSEAAIEFDAGGELLRKAGRVDDWARVTERLLYHRPDDARVARDLATHYLERNDAKRALPKLQVAFKANPRDVDVLEMLASAFFALGQSNKMVPVLKEIARILLEKNELERRVEVCKRILKIAPDDPDAKAAMQATERAIAATKAPVVVAEDPPDIEVDVDSSDDDQVVVDDVEFSDSVLPPPVAPTKNTPTPLTTQPKSRASSSNLTRVASVAGTQKTAPTRKSEPKMSPVTPPQAPQPQVVEPQPTSLPSLVATEEGRQIAEELIAAEPVHPDVAKATSEVEIFLKYNLRTKAIAHLSKALEIDPRALSVHARLRDILELQGDRVAAGRHAAYVAAVLAGQDLDAATWAVLRAIELDPSNAEALDLYARIAEVASLPDDQYQDPDAVNVEGNSTSELTSFEAVDVPGDDQVVIDEDAALVDGAPQSLAPDVEAGLDEVEFYVSQGLYPDAAETLKALLAQYPTHPLVLERWEEVQALAQAQAEDADQSFALAEKLAEEVHSVQSDADQQYAGGEQMIDVETVFAQFKQGVAKVVSADDAETHYDLGIAYKEMGLTDDAINEFMVAAQAPRKQCLAQNMIGMCMLEKGDPAAAIPWFEQALTAPLRSDREEMGLFYELGNAYEFINDPIRALDYFRRAQNRDPRFRDVQERVRRLTPHASRSNATVPEMDDVDRAFDELLKG
jgi:tetratricopeptide (TPR) repeat protein